MNNHNKKKPLGSFILVLGAFLKSYFSLIHHDKGETNTYHQSQIAYIASESNIAPPFSFAHQVKFGGSLFNSVNEPGWSEIKLSQFITTNKPLNFNNVTLGLKTKFSETVSNKLNRLSFHIDMENTVWLVSSDPLTQDQLKSSLIIKITKPITTPVSCNAFLEFQPIRFSNNPKFYWKLSLNLTQNCGHFTISTKPTNLIGFEQSNFGSITSYNTISGAHLKQKVIQLLEVLQLSMYNAPQIFNWSQIISAPNIAENIKSSNFQSQTSTSSADQGALSTKRVQQNTLVKKYLESLFIERPVIQIDNSAYLKKAQPIKGNQSRLTHLEVSYAPFIEPCYSQVEPHNVFETLYKYHKLKNQLKEKQVYNYNSSFQSQSILENSIVTNTKSMNESYILLPPKGIKPISLNLNPSKVPIVIEELNKQEQKQQQKPEKNENSLKPQTSTIQLQNTNSKANFNSAPIATSNTNLNTNKKDSTANINKNQTNSNKKNSTAKVIQNESTNKTGSENQNDATTCTQDDFITRKEKAIEAAKLLRQQKKEQKKLTFALLGSLCFALHITNKKYPTQYKNTLKTDKAPELWISLAFGLLAYGYSETFEKWLLKETKKIAGEMIDEAQLFVIQKIVKTDIFLTLGKVIVMCCILSRPKPDNPPDIDFSIFLDPKKPKGGDDGPSYDIDFSIFLDPKKPKGDDDGSINKNLKESDILPPPKLQKTSSNLTKKKEKPIGKPVAIRIPTAKYFGL